MDCLSYFQKRRDCDKVGIKEITVATGTESKQEINERKTKKKKSNPRRNCSDTLLEWHIFTPCLLSLYQMLIPNKYIYKSCIGIRFDVNMP